MTKWHNKKDSLPQKTMMCLVYDAVSKHGPYISRFDKEIENFTNMGWNDNSVTHWRKLPKTPKEGD